MIILSEAVLILWRILQGTCLHRGAHRRTQRQQQRLLQPQKLSALRLMRPLQRGGALVARAPQSRLVVFPPAQSRQEEQTGLLPRPLLAAAFSLGKAVPLSCQ